MVDHHARPGGTPDRLPDLPTAVLVLLRPATPWPRSAALRLQTPESLRETLDIDVRISTEVTAIDPAARTVIARNLITGQEYTETWDKLALCPGSSPFRPPLPGLDHPDIHVLRNIEDMDEIKAKVDAIACDPDGLKHVVVIGAGYIGLEMAENLHERGLAVEIVEMADQIMPPLDKELSTPMENYLRAHGISLHLSTAAAVHHGQGWATHRRADQRPVPEDVAGHHERGCPT